MFHLLLLRCKQDIQSHYQYYKALNLKLYNIGNEIEYPAYTSATIGETYNPSGEVQLTIISKTARNITTLNKLEQEILFERGKKFKVLQRIEINGKHFIQMEELWVVKVLRN